MNTKNDQNDIFRKLLEYQQIYLSYLYVEKGDYHGWRTNVFILVNFIQFSRFWCLYLVDVNSCLVNYLADPIVQLGTARNPINFIFAVWVLGGIFAAINIKLSEILLKRQKWTIIAQVINENKYYDVPINPLISKLFIYSVKINPLLGVFCLIIYSIPAFFQADYWFATIGLMVSLFGGFGGGVFYLNAAILHCLHHYSIAKYFDEKRKKLLIDKYSTIKKASLSKIGKILKEANQSNNFYSPICESTFLASFIGQVVVIYCIFFVELSFTFLFIFSTLLVLNFISGQSLYFLAGTNAQAKVKIVQLN